MTIVRVPALALRDIAEIDREHISTRRDVRRHEREDLGEQRPLFMRLDVRPPQHAAGLSLHVETAHHTASSTARWQTHMVMVSIDLVQALRSRMAVGRG